MIQGKATGPVDILLVDDHPAKITALESALAPLGQNLVTVTSGRDALRALLTHNFATVILDVNMPGMDGFETAQLIRGRPRSAHTPIIFVSSVNLAETDALRGYSLGAVDYILAPIIPEILRAKVSVFVDLHRKTEEARVRAAELEERTRELQESQQQLRIAERLASLGTLSAGLGHDMGNVLLPIQARLESLEGEPLSEPVRETLDGIRSCVAYLRRLAQGLRMLSRAPEEGSGDHATELAGWWNDVEPMCRNALPSGVTLEHDIPEGLPWARLARHQLTQLVFNLIQNAGDALRNRGSGRVRVAASHEPARPGGARVRVTVSDDGPGMPPEVRVRCFEPFFSTKPRALSTGMGLALVHGIVHRCGGEITVASEPGRGTTFCCALPVAPPPAARPASATAAFVDVADGRMRSLVSSLLGSGGMTLASQGERDRAAVWVCDAGSDSARAALKGASGRHVLLLGDAGAASPRRPGLRIVSPDQGAGALRRELRALLVDAAGACEVEVPASAGAARTA